MHLQFLFKLPLTSGITVPSIPDTKHLFRGVSNSGASGIFLVGMVCDQTVERNLVAF